MTYADLSSLPPVPHRRGDDVETLRSEIVSTIEAAIVGAPRSKQRAIGPSEMGHPCDRRIAYRLAGVGTVNDRPGWRPTVGTAVHTWLAETFAVANEKWRQETGNEGTRWLVEMRVEVGEAGGEVITGSCDLYDRVTATLIDWKIVAATTLREAKANGPSEQYRRQSHLYGRGWTRRGLPVDTIGVYYLPSSGELHEGHLWTEPYDEQVAVDTLERANNLAALTTTFGDKAFPVIGTDGANERLCRYCPFYLPASTDLAAACPGAVKKAKTSDVAA